MLIPYCSYLHNTPPPPFNPAHGSMAHWSGKSVTDGPSTPGVRGAPGQEPGSAGRRRSRGAGRGRSRGRRGGGGEEGGTGKQGTHGGSFGIYRPNGLAVSLGAGRQPVTSERSYLL